MSSASAAAAAASQQPSQQQQQQHQQQQQQHQQQRLRLPLPSPLLPPGVQPTRVQWLQTGYADPSHHPQQQQSPQQQQQQQQRYVLYWMQRSVRSECNHALECAIHHANHLGLPILVVFCFLKTYPGANERGFAFLLEGLSEVQALLARRGIRMVVREAQGSVPQAVLDTARRVRAPLLVTDRGYERILRAWRREVAAQSPCPVLQVESDVVVPVETATGGRALNATAAFRTAQAQHLNAHLVPLPEGRVRRPSVVGEGAAGVGLVELPDEFDVRDPEALLASLDAIDRSVKRVPFKRGGPTQAKALLARFLRDKLSGYATHRKEAHLRHQSFLSPYFHFGHISALYVALKVKQHTGSSAEDRRRFLDEMLCWREMAVHFVYHHPDNYDDYSVLPVWARDSLHEHQGDPRTHVYTLQELEEGRTHDPLWNAAQLEMVVSGYVNNYIRMLWCKLIIAWTNTPQEAYRTALMLNDKYFLDGRDCNGYFGVAWCLGFCDRPMPVSPIYGKVRRMTSSGARNKMDVDAYIAQVRDLALKTRGPRAQALGIADHTYAKPLRTTIDAFFSGGGGPAASTASSASSAATPAAARALREEGSGGGGGGSTGKRPAMGGGKQDGEDGEDGQGKKPKKKGSITDFFAAKKKE